MGTKLHTEALDIPAQIENLKACNLIIEDEEDAARILNRISYYRLIKAYGSAFKSKSTGKYRDGTTFMQIYRVYEFDNKLRHILIPYLQDIEITFRCQIANYFCVKYGVLGYLEVSNFSENASYSELSEKINRCIEQSKESPIIKNFRENYVGGNIPLYAAVEVFTFGTLALFYGSMKVEDRKAIAAMYKNVNEHYLASWLVSISYVRNLCTHFNRLYNRILIKQPLLYKKKQDKGIDNSKLFAVLCCMRYLCQDSGNWPGFVNSLDKLLMEFDDCVKPSNIGCIKQWKDKLLDQEPVNSLKLHLENLQADQ